MRERGDVGRAGHERGSRFETCCSTDSRRPIGRPESKIRREPDSIGAKLRGSLNRHVKATGSDAHASTSGLVDATGGRSSGFVLAARSANARLIVALLAATRRHGPRVSRSPSGHPGLARRANLQGSRASVPTRAPTPSPVTPTRIASRTKVSAASASVHPSVSVEVAATPATDDLRARPADWRRRPQSRRKRVRVGRLVGLFLLVPSQRLPGTAGDARIRWTARAGEYPVGGSRQARCACW
jgi:hypothetical protein